MNTPICKNCSASFEITDQDLKFYKKMDVPPPTFCPDCRLQRRLIWRNEYRICKRKCDLCKKDFISFYNQDSPYTVYCQNCWWSDNWDPKKYSEEINFEEPFFTQFERLLKKTPHLGITNDRTTLVNSEYVAYVSDAKNCYLVFASNFLEDCMYSHYIWESKDTTDCSNSTKLELCYECVDCDQLFNCDYLEASQSCHDCTLSYNLKNCDHCLGCVSLRHKSYCIANKPVSKEEFEKTVKEFRNDKQKFQELTNAYTKFKYEFPRLSSLVLNSENSTGDAIKNCKNALECFEGYDGEDLKWVRNFPGKMKDCYDIFGCAELELAVDSKEVGLGAYNMKYTASAFNNVRDIQYSAFTMNSCHDLFGCVSLKNSQYCILNKQYSKEEYKSLLPHIITHMTKTSEYGEFFPASMSPFAYNKTIAQDYFPLTKEEALKKGYKWRD